MKHRYLSILLAAIAAASQAQTTQTPTPKLVVNIVIDQLRTDRLEQYAQQFGQDGFKKLLANGVVYSNASYPFMPVDRASAIASVTTGTTPYYNGISGNRWLNKNTLRPMDCVDDKDFAGVYTQDKSSAQSLQTSTIGDELKMSSAGAAIVYGVAAFRDAAILSAGHAADGALWIDDQSGEWCGSTYYFRTVPKWLSSYNVLYAPSKKTVSLKSSDKALSLQNKYKYFKTSQHGNTSVTDMALQCVATSLMGMDATPDLLAVTYYAGEPQTQTKSQSSMLDIYKGLDKEVARLISTVESKVGRGNTLYVISGTGYEETDNDEYAKYRVPSGTFYINRTANLLNIFLSAIYGQARYVEGFYRNQIYLNHKLLEQKRISLTDIYSRCEEFLTQCAGVREVFTAVRLASAGSVGAERVKNGYNTNTCGDILIEIAPGWKVLDENTNEHYHYRSGFADFPIIIFGAGTKPQRISSPVTADQIAPTIAKSIRIRAPNGCYAQTLRQ